jgi:midasin
MNPGSDVGKKELPANIKLKFTSFYIEDISKKSDLIDFVKGVLKGI